MRETSPIPSLTPEAEALFWSKVERGPGCWEWCGGASRKGYGRVRVRGRLVSPHRLSFALAHGAVPDGLWVLHTCDNPRCVRPEHLFAGTHADNMKDASRKGRLRQLGPGPWNAKIGPGQVREIRALRAEGLTCREIAARYGLHRYTVGQIARRVRWGSVQ